MKSDNLFKVVLFISFFVKLSWINYVEYWPTMDAENYLRTAKTITQGNFPDIYWPIGYSALLAIIYPFKSILLMKFVNVILSTLTIFFLMKISEIYYRKSSLKELIILSLFPESVFYCSTLWSETFFLFLLTGSIFFQLKERNVVSGFFYAIQFFVRPVSIFLPFVIRFFVQRIKKTDLKVFIPEILMPIIILHLIWSSFIYYKTEKIVFVSTNGSVNLFIGNNPKATGHYDEDGLRYASQNNIINEKYTSSVVNYIFSNYYEYPLLISKKIYFLIFGEGRDFKASSAIAIHHLSKMPKIISKSQYENIKNKINDKNILEKAYFRAKDEDWKYIQKSQLSDYEISKLAHDILYTFETTYDIDYTILANISTIFILFFCFSSFFILTIIGLNRDRLILIPIYFILFYSVFFGSPRYLFPVYPFFILYTINNLKKINRRTTGA